MLKVSNLTKTYAGNEKSAIENVSFDVRDGEIFGFIGPNGAGKSTTIKCITGILNFESGSIEIDGNDIRANAIAAKRLVGYVSDNHIIYDKLTGIEFVNFMCDMFGVDPTSRKERLDKYLNCFELTKAIGDPIKSYSHGMKQKLNIIGALIHNPKIWILDEPLLGLDPKSSYNLKQLMREHAQAGNSVFFSSHMLEIVEKVCDRVGIIDHGKMITCCSVADLQNSEIKTSLEDLFLSITSKNVENQVEKNEDNNFDLITDKNSDKFDLGNDTDRKGE
ncbi:MAG: ABC transporter ATP-binding protein [Clostridia bacterium]|nr:ABC transporter ATP-binding protein [Clostridia bacterium]